MMVHVLLILALVASPFSSASSLSPRVKIEVYLEVPRLLPYEVYVERTNLCPEMQDKILELLPVAFEIHRQSLIRFVGEMGRIYDKMLSAQFVEVKDASSADLIFRVVDLTPPNAGLTYIVPEPPLAVQIDCDLGFSATREGIVTLILHELYHALGVGHTERPVTNELMGHTSSVSTLQQILYPSTLDLMAVYYVHFIAPQRQVMELYSLPSSVPYVVVAPYDVEVQRLSEEVSDLKLENNALRYTLYNDLVWLNSTVSRLGRGLETLNATVTETGNRIDTLSSSIDSLSSRLDTLSGRQDELESRLDSSVTEIGGLKSSITSLEAYIRELQGQIGRLSAENAEIKAQLQRLTAVAAVAGLLAIAVSVASSLAVLRRRRAAVRAA